MFTRPGHAFRPRRPIAEGSPRVALATAHPAAPAFAHAPEAGEAGESVLTRCTARDRDEATAEGGPTRDEDTLAGYPADPRAAAPAPRWPLPAPAPTGIARRRSRSPFPSMPMAPATDGRLT